MRIQQKIGDLTLPGLCLGTMTFGEQTSEAQSHDQLDYALERGVNFIDTAEMYAVPPRAETYGETERIIGNWLRNQERDKLIIATKVAGPARNFTWIRGGPRSLDRTNIRAALEDSLRRLQTDYVDLYQIHWPERNLPTFGAWSFDPESEREAVSIRSQLETLAELVDEGKVRAIGVSNEQPWGVMQFIHLSKVYELPRILTIQNAYNLLNRCFEYSLHEVCYRESVGLLPYSLLAFGVLTGKYLEDTKAQGRLSLFPGFGQRYSKPNVVPATNAYCELARKHGLSPVQLAVSFACSQPFVSSAILGASTLQQLQEQVEASEIRLSSEVLSAIDDIHLRYTNPAP